MSIKKGCGIKIIEPSFESLLITYIYVVILYAPGN